jgi:transglutaminase-like putative cysteine protease
MSLSTTVALSRLVAHPTNLRLIGPLVVAVLVADTVTALVASRRVNTVVAMVIGAAAAVLSLLVTVHPSNLSTQLHAALYALENDGTPLPQLTGVALLIGAIGGGVAALTRGFWVLRTRTTSLVSGRVGPLIPSVVPSFAVFIYTTLVSAEHGRVPAAIAYFIGVVVFVTLADRRTSLAAPTAGLRRPTIAISTVAIAGLALLLVIGAGAGLSGMKLSVFHVTPPKATPTPGTSPNGTSQNLITGISLVDNLLATEIQQSNKVIFQATSPESTYWQVGTLSAFDGTQWLPSAGVNSALAGTAGSSALGPTSLPSPASGQEYTTQVRIIDFYSRLLPAPPRAVSVSGLPDGASVSGEGVLATAPSEAGTDYAVTARVPLSVATDSPQLSSSDSRLAPYLSLPSQPAVVDQLAHQAEGSARTPAAQAQALVNYFRSGQFRYTLSPPPTTGSDPLVQFLTVTKAGFCQQFAGAYGVLARALGIPTRLEVGFTSGAAGPNNTFTVTGADAHVWPQVYLGPDAGWVSVEPTPPAATGSAPPDGVIGPSAASTPSTDTATTAAGQTTPANPTAGTQPTGTHRAAPHHKHTKMSHGSWLWLLVVGLAVLLLAAGVVVTLRRRRLVRGAGLRPDQQVVLAWERTQRAMRRRGLARRTAETPTEYATRLRVGAADTPAASTMENMADLAALVEVACYTPGPCTPGQAARAEMLSSSIVGSGRSHRRRPARSRQGS